MAKTIQLNKETVDEIQRVYYEFITHRSIVTELVNTNPTISIGETQVYKDYQKVFLEYDKCTTRIIRENIGEEYNSGNVRWTIDFDRNQLIIEGE